VTRTDSTASRKLSLQMMMVMTDSKQSSSRVICLLLLSIFTSFVTSLLFLSLQTHFVTVHVCSHSLITAQFLLTLNENHQHTHCIRETSWSKSVSLLWGLVLTLVFYIH